MCLFRGGFPVPFARRPLQGRLGLKHQTVESVQGISWERSNPELSSVGAPGRVVWGRGAPTSGSACGQGAPLCCYSVNVGDKGRQGPKALFQQQSIWGAVTALPTAEALSTALPS